MIDIGLTFGREPKLDDVIAKLQLFNSLLDRRERTIRRLKAELKKNLARKRRPG
jgi:hypothetical protein